MRNSIKVAKWELKRNVKAKSFVISLLLTPLIFIAFSLLPSLFQSEETTPEEVTVYVAGDTTVQNMVQSFVTETSLRWIIEPVIEGETTTLKKIRSTENAAYLSLTAENFQEGIISVYTSEEIPSTFESELNQLVIPLQQLQLQSLDLTAEQAEIISRGLSIQTESITDHGTDVTTNTNEDDPLKRLVPGIFAGVILFSIIMSGMLIFQSASQEKKEKVAEIVLSSLRAEELMQGKIIGYFVLGIFQIFVWIIILVPFLMWHYDLPITDYLFVPETLLFVFIAILGYLLFAAIFAGIGATFEEVDSTSNFQGLVFLLPFLPVVLIGPVLSNPEGIIAKVATYFPITAPGVLITRLTFMDTWPWSEIIISLVILTISLWVFMKIAGKIFKIGILIYGKNATPKEIWKWIRY